MILLIQIYDRVYILNLKGWYYVFKVIEISLTSIRECDITFSKRWFLLSQTIARYFQHKHLIAHTCWIFNDCPQAVMYSLRTSLVQAISCWIKYLEKWYRLFEKRRTKSISLKIYEKIKEIIQRQRNISQISIYYIFYSPFLWFLA